MVQAVAEAMRIIGIDAVPPTNLVELIPYLLVVFIGVVLITGVFHVIGGVLRAVLNSRRF